MPRRSNLPKTVFSSGPNELDTKITIFTKRNGVGMFTEELARSSTIEVGQELQFRGIVRPGDGKEKKFLHNIAIY